MKTFSAKPADVTREWFVIDADNKVLGRIATEIALRLRGKHKPVYTPHVDTGDHSVVINADKIAVTGNKEEGKIYYVRSYAKDRKKPTYGLIRTISPSSILVDLESVTINNGGNPYAIGLLLDDGTGVDEYGFIWAKDTIPAYDNNDGIWITSLNFSGNWLSDEKAVFFCVMV